MAYAKRTKVTGSRTRSEIEDLLRKYKAKSTAIFTEEGGAAVAFEMSGRRVLFRVTMAKGAAPNDEQRRKERWRALLLAIKSKLVSVEEGIESFEEAFMAHVVMPDGSRVADHVRPRIESAYKSQKMVPLLPGPQD